MSKQMIYAEAGDPWEFPRSYQSGNYNIQFVGSDNFEKEGPLAGRLLINDQEVSCHKYAGFGGPILIKGDQVYLPLYQYPKDSADYGTTFLAEVNLSARTFRVIGKKVVGAIIIDHLDGDILYYYNSCNKESKHLKTIDINTDYIPWTRWDKIRHICSELGSLIGDFAKDLPHIIGSVFLIIIAVICLIAFLSRI